MATLSFSIAASSFDTSLLPSAARQVGTPAFREAVNEFLAAEFRDFGGNANIRVDDHTIAVVWSPDSQQPNPMAVIAQKLQQGKYPEGIQLLELLLSSQPDDSIALYNLGLALSDTGRLERAEQCLRRAAELNPRDVNISVALGVALGRMGRDAEGVEVLRIAVEQDQNNPWAQRTLGGLLLRTGKALEAIPHCKLAAKLLPQDQIAWLGLTDAYRLTGDAAKAEHAYRKSVEISPHSELAEKARAGSNLLAQSSFDQVRQVVPRQDAVHYCLAAMKRYASMSPSELQKLTLALAMEGQRGFAVHNPDSRYRVKGLEGDYSGLAMVCYLYVAMQRLAPGNDIGFDVSVEYEQAKKIFDAGG